MRQGEIRWCDFAPPDHPRPAVIVTRDNSIASLNSLTLAPITTAMRGTPTRVPVGMSEGLREPSEVNARNLQTLPKAAIGGLIATLSDEHMRAINAAIAYALGFDRYEDA